MELGVAEVMRLGQAMGAAGVGDDVGAHAPGHHEGDPDPWRAAQEAFRRTER